MIEKQKIVNSSIPINFNWNPSPTTYFALLLVGYPLIQLFVQPRWLLSGGVWAEAGTNYFVNANSSNLFEQLFSTDSGYIPLPQRLIALTAKTFNFPAESIPYFYSWIALFFSAAMVAFFCLKPFRSVIQSDFSRFVFSSLILSFSEWGVRTFINFTYYGLFFTAIIGALIYVSRNAQIELPWYLWITPILILSKPAVLASVPFLLYALVARANFKKSKLLLALIALVSTVQVIQIIISRFQGVFDRGVIFKIEEQIPDIFLYLLGIPGSLILGIEPSKNLFLVLACGIVVIFAALWIIRIKGYGFELITSGLSLFVFSLILNSVTLFDHWNSKTWVINSVPVTNHSLGPYIGALIVCFGILIWSLRSLKTSRFHAFIGPTFFILVIGWFFFSGWSTYLTMRAQQPSWPISGNSNWVQSSSLINSGENSACVPIDPIGWVYGPDCRGLNWPDWNSTDEHFLIQDTKWLIQNPSELSGEEVSAMEIAAKSATGRQSYINLKVEFTLIDGNTISFIGSGNIDNSPLGITLSGEPVVLNEIQAIEITSSDSIKVMGKTAPNTFIPTILWMGR